MTAPVKTLSLFAAWTVATYLFEGLPRTLLRPEAVGLRLAYATVVNIGIGVIGSLWIARGLITAGVLNERVAGFAVDRRTLSGIAAGAVLGAALFLTQRPPSLDPVILVNGFSQVLVVSAAEVLVCWAVVGATLESTLRKLNMPLPRILAALAASALFGLYHLAHSPPFNSMRMVLLLTATGLITSAFFFTFRSAYGTIILHNFLGLFGVLDALARAGRLSGLQRPAVPLIVTAGGAILLVLLLHRTWLRSSAERGDIHVEPVRRP